MVVFLVCFCGLDSLLLGSWAVLVWLLILI